MHIVIVNRWPRFDDDPKRWDNELTRYEEFIDHQTNQVSYIVDANGKRGIQADAALIQQVVEVEDVNVYEQLLAACQAVTDTVGKIDSLIVLSEFTLEVAAKVRETLNIDGPKTDEVKAYRDKVCMKEIVQQSGLAVPKFTELNEDSQAEDFSHWDLPLILKPRGGAASIGVHKVETRDQLAQLFSTIALSDYELEEFIEGDVYHIDGYVNAKGDVAFQCVSRYVNDCLAFSNEGAPLGSYIVKNDPVGTAIEAFSLKVCRALSLSKTPFHLEVFWSQGQPVFLEIGARVGGAEVPHLINRVFGVNLYHVWLTELSGQPMPSIKPKETGAGGWLIFPKPEDVAKKVVNIAPLKTEIQGIWRELIPDQGDVLAPGGSYDALHCGRYIVECDTSAEVRETIEEIVKRFKCELEVVK